MAPKKKCSSSLVNVSVFLHTKLFIHKTVYVHYLVVKWKTNLSNFKYHTGRVIIAQESFRQLVKLSRQIAEGIERDGRIQFNKESHHKKLGV